MKIAILSIFFPPKWLGGTEVASLNLAKELAKNKKNEINVITSYNKELENFNEKFKIHLVKILDLPKLKIFSYILKTILKIREINPDIVHCQSTVPGLSAFFSGKPYIIYCQGSDIYLAGGLQKIINKFVLKRAKHVISLTKDMQDRIKKDYNIRSVVIPNGINICNFDLDRKKLREEFKLNDKKIVLYVGTLKKVKGLEYLINAFKLIEEKSSNTKLWIIGDGPERENIELLTKKFKMNNIVFFGKKDNKDIPKYMNVSDLLVLPSLSEGFPITILEAMAAGLPIVTSNLPQISEIFKEWINGFLVKPKNSEEIAEKVLLLLKDQKLREKFSKNNLRDVKKYSWEKTAKQLENIYKNVTD